MQAIHIAKRLIIWYFVLVGLTAHALLASILILYPEIRYKMENKLYSILNLDVIDISKANIATELSTNFGTWKPLETTTLKPHTVMAGDHEFPNMQAAADSLQPGGIMEIGPGTYKSPLVIKQNQITVIGRGHVILDGPVAEDKGAILIKGNNSRIINLECKNISVPDGNGACIRLEGANLDVEHVYFHSSQEGILTGKQPGVVNVKDSRFELLGQSGQSHGIYTNGGELHIEDSLFVAAVNEGHEIKSRSRSTEIVKTIVASLSSLDSRLVDIPNGGLVSIRDSILEKGPGSSNGDAIGYGLEGMKYNNNYLELKNNVIILERNGPNNLLHFKPGDITPNVTTNVIISRHETNFTDSNLWEKSRKQAGLEKYPFIPLIR